MKEGPVFLRSDKVFMAPFGVNVDDHVLGSQ